MYYEKYINYYNSDQKFYLESLVMSRSQVTLLLLGKAGCI